MRTGLFKSCMFVTDYSFQNMPVLGERAAAGSRLFERRLICLFVGVLSIHMWIGTGVLQGLPVMQLASIATGLSRGHCVTFGVVNFVLLKPGCAAGIVKALCEAIAKNCPKAWVAIISNPVNSTVPIAAEVFKRCGAGCAADCYREPGLELCNSWSLTMTHCDGSPPAFCHWRFLISWNICCVLQNHAFTGGILCLYRCACKPTDGV